MSAIQPAVGQHAFLARAGLSRLVEALKADGYTVMAPILRQGVLALGAIDSAEQIPRGVRDEQEAGRYRLARSDPDLFFQYVVGADSPKRFLIPPSLPLFDLRLQDGSFVFRNTMPKPPKLALLGIRPCDLAAIHALDRVFASRSRCETDVYFNRVRQQLLIIVVNCTRPGGTCFCNSMGTGPAATEGFDLSLTELRAGFVLKVGSARGAQLAAKLELREPSPAELELMELRLDQAREHMGRHMQTAGLAQILEQNPEHPYWQEIASKCLGCGNCTMVCPTCFCSSMVDGNDLASGEASRTRLWDSCYTHQFTYTTAGPVRASIRGRHRHWVRHKLSTFWEQFNCSGCVGCGRCITWCPVGIDITAEVAAIRGRADQAAARPQESEVLS